MIQYLIGHKGSLLALRGMGRDVVGKEEQFENNEDDKQFDDVNKPQGTPQTHLSEPVTIEATDTTYS